MTQTTMTCKKRDIPFYLFFFLLPFALLSCSQQPAADPVPLPPTPPMTHPAADPLPVPQAPAPQMPAPKQETTTTSQAAVSSCDTTTVSTQANFVCAAPGYEEGCTCFVCGRPAACAVVDTTDAVTPKLNILAPQIACTGNVEYRCGGSVPKLLAQGMRVISTPVVKQPCVGAACNPPLPVDTSCQDDFDCPDIQQCNAGRCVTPQIEPPLPLVTGCKDDIDCGGSKICSLQKGTCEEPAPTPMLSGSLTARVSANYLGVADLNWRVQKGSAAITEAYLYGHFNRAKGETCDKIENNGAVFYLVTNQDGTRFASDSINADKSRYGYYLTGTECKDDPKDKDYCFGLTDFKARFKGNLPDVPVCRIDLKEALTNGKTGQVMYTNMPAPQAAYALYVKDAQGGEIKQGVTAADKVVEAPKPQMTSRATVRLDKPLLHISMSYQYLIAPPFIFQPTMNGIVPCVFSGQPTRDGNGSGSAEADCEIKNGLTAIVQGPGAGGILNEGYALTLETPTPILKHGAMECQQGGSQPANGEDCSGMLPLYWSIDRPCRIEKIDANLSHSGEACGQPDDMCQMDAVDGDGKPYKAKCGKVPWVQSVQVFSYDGQIAVSALPVSAEIKMDAQDKTSGSVKAARDHSHFHWLLKWKEIGANDFGDDRTYAYDSFGYKPFLDVADVSPNLTLTYGEMRNNSCKNVSGSAVHMKFNVTHKNMRSIVIECSGPRQPNASKVPLATTTITPAPPPVIASVKDFLDPNEWGGQLMEMNVMETYGASVLTMQVDQLSGYHEGGDGWGARIYCAVSGRTYDGDDITVGQGTRILVDQSYSCRF